MLDMNQNTAQSAKIVNSKDGLWKVSFRSVIIGSLLIPFNVYWVLLSEIRWYYILTINPLFVTPIFYLFVLAGLNYFIKKYLPKFAFKHGELAVIYIMLVISCTVATHDYMINLVSVMSWPVWNANEVNNWNNILIPLLPKWLIIRDIKALEGFHIGKGNFYEPNIYKVWLAPMAYWSIFIIASGWIMLCLSVIFRKAWTEDTKLTFPIVKLPMTIIGDEDSPINMMKSPVLWAGFAVVALLSLYNYIQLQVPELPNLQVTKRPINFINSPWNAIGTIWFTAYPFAIGLAYLIPLDISFSCWFFYLFLKFQAVLGVYLGFGSVPDMPFQVDQNIGAWFVFCFSLLYLSRKHLKQVFKTAFIKNDNFDENEPMRYKTAIIGLIIGMYVFYYFWRATGMTPTWVIVVLFSYLMISIAITRIRAESGSQHNVWEPEPRYLFRLFGSNILGTQNYVSGYLSHWYWRLNRSHIMPSQFEALKLAKDNKICLKSLILPLMIALVLATIFSGWASLDIFYKEGALGKSEGFPYWTIYETYDLLSNILINGEKVYPVRWGAVGFAAGFTALLAWLRTRFVGFPFHPLGYCVGPGLIWLWGPFLISWFIKLILLRYGGYNKYKAALPFFIGLVLGDYTMGAIWSIVTIYTKLPTPHIYH
ncbi:MAG: DUF6785 family protein [Armatimonadota bacterium]